jgi:hypothetical protein
MVTILQLVLAVLAALPIFLFCITFVRLFVAPRELWMANGVAFLFCLPSAFFGVQAGLENATNTPLQTNDSIYQLVIYGFPALIVALILYTSVRGRLSGGWWLEAMALVVAVVSTNYFFEM